MEAEIEMLNAPLPCQRSGCSGHLREVSLREARALCEYGLRGDPHFRLRGDCTVCGLQSEYAYSEIINRIPPPLRPQDLAGGQAWALVLLPGPHVASGDRCFIG